MSTLTEPTHHPSDETLAALIDGKLEGEARRKAIEHMSVCGECRSVFLAGEAAEANFLEAERPRTRTKIRATVGDRKSVV